MKRVNIVLVDVYKRQIEIIGLALVGSIGDVFLCQFLDGSEDGIRAACTKGRMIREDVYKRQRVL